MKLDSLSLVDSFGINRLAWFSMLIISREGPSLK